MAWFGHKTDDKVKIDAVKKKFDPKPDITAYEAAYILGRCGGLGTPSYEVCFTQEK